MEHSEKTSSSRVLTRDSEALERSSVRPGTGTPRKVYPIRVASVQEQVD